MQTNAMTSLILCLCLPAVTALRMNVPSQLTMVRDPEDHKSDGTVEGDLRVILRHDCMGTPSTRPWVGEGTGSGFWCLSIAANAAEEEGECKDRVKTMEKKFSKQFDEVAGEEKVATCKAMSGLMAYLDSDITGTQFRLAWLGVAPLTPGSPLSNIILALKATPTANRTAFAVTVAAGQGRPKEGMDSKMTKKRGDCEKDTEGSFKADECGAEGHCFLRKKHGSFTKCFFEERCMEHYDKFVENRCEEGKKDKKKTKKTEKCFSKAAGEIFANGAGRPAGVGGAAPAAPAAAPTPDDILLGNLMAYKAILESRHNPLTGTYPRLSTEFQKCLAKSMACEKPKEKYSVLR